MAVPAVIAFFLVSPKLKFEKKFFFAYLFFFFCMFVVTIFSQDIPVSIKRVWGYLRYSSLLFFPLIFIHDRKQIMQLLWIFCISFLIYDCIIIWDWLQGAARAVGPKSDIMETASLLTTQFAVLLAVSFSKQDLSKEFLIFSRFVLLMSVLALLANVTRGAWLACVVTIFVYFIFSLWLYKDKKNFLGILSVIFFCALLYLFSPTIGEKAITVTDPDHTLNRERVLLWESSCNMFSDHKLTGLGPGNFGKYYREHYILPEAKEDKLDDAHNNYFHMLAETGIIGIIAYLYLLFTLLWLSFRAFYRKRENIMALACFLMVIAFMVKGLSEFSFGRGSNMRLIWFLVGMFLAMKNVLSEPMNVKNK